MNRFEEIVYPLVWIALFTAAGTLYPRIMPVSIFAAVVLGVYCVRMLMVRRVD